MHGRAVKRTAKPVAESPNSCPQTADIIDPFCKLSASDTGLPAVLVYFQTSLYREKLNKVKPIALSKHLVQLKRLSVLEKLIKRNKVTITA